jgi:C-terminal processing protease CtpA/Prc
MRQLSAFALLAIAAAAQPVPRAGVAGVLGFEHGWAGGSPTPWAGTTDAAIDDQVFRSGRFAARIQRGATSTGTFSALFITVPAEFQGRTLEWRGYLKNDGVSDAVALWARVDGPSGTLAFSTTQGMQVNGTRDWTEYSVSVALSGEARQVVAGFLLSGTGTVWADDFTMLVDGRPIADAPARPPSVLERDREFDSGSRVAVSALSDIQVRNLVTLARVWGFLKYHHPAVGAGEYQWDYELFRILPNVLASSDASEANRVIYEWVARFGSPDCVNCATLNTEQAHLLPQLAWIDDSDALGTELSEALQSVYRRREARSSQFYVRFLAGAGNPSFENELTYPQMRPGDSGFQLLALFRYWNMIEYFFPYRDVISDDPEGWVRALAESIPGIATANTLLGYQQELIKFIAKINDTHANLWSSLSARPPIGLCQLPADIRFVEGKAYVIRNNSRAPVQSGLGAGDLILRLDGTAVEDLIAEWTPYYAASNEPTRLRDIGNYMTLGHCGPVSVTLDRAGETVAVQETRVPLSTLDLSRMNRHDRLGDTFQKLADDIAYLKLGTVVAANSRRYIEQAEGTRGLIIDIRNYPAEFVVFTLGQHLVDRPGEFVRFTRGDAANPGAFHWGPTAALTPAAPRYTGKIVILIDEVTQSQAEYTTMAFRTAPGAVVIGSTTAGADGNVSTVPLPGNLRSLFSGIGVFYPDKRPTQRIGIIPDIELRPTIQGLREGRDELIDEAIRIIRSGP